MAGSVVLLGICKLPPPKSQNPVRAKLELKSKSEETMVPSVISLEVIAVPKGLMAVALAPFPTYKISSFASQEICP